MNPKLPFSQTLTPCWSRLQIPVFVLYMNEFLAITSELMFDFLPPRRPQLSLLVLRFHERLLLQQPLYITLDANLRPCYHTR